VTRTLPLLALLLATACTTTRQADVSAAGAAGDTAAATAASAAAPAADPAAEDARLLAFLDAAFEESIARSPQTLTGLGRKELYDRLNDYTEAETNRQLALSRIQLSQLRNRFDRTRTQPRRPAQLRPVRI
jgi:hypothetical protein